jgi:hypothetical protein
MSLRQRRTGPSGVAGALDAAAQAGIGAKANAGAKTRGYETLHRHTGPHTALLALVPLPVRIMLALASSVSLLEGAIFKLPATAYPMYMPQIDIFTHTGLLMRSSLRALLPNFPINATPWLCPVCA